MSKNNNKNNSSELENCLFNPKKLEDSINKVKRINELPLVLTNKDLKESSPDSCVKYYTMFYRSLIDQT